MVHEDLVMMPEVDARRVLSGRALSFVLLAPVSPSLGVGRLRVLRVKPSASDEDAGFELVCGYESYERIDA